MATSATRRMREIRFADSAQFKEPVTTGEYEIFIRCYNCAVDSQTMIPRGTPHLRGADVPAVMCLNCGCFTMRRSFLKEEQWAKYQMRKSKSDTDTLLNKLSSSK